ncbi:MAG: (2Fe-2S)-binding protein [Desulfobacterota bacterium]|nr:(2Fe-2S)-binding protein [Thermodesulfobacteriota bacterium]
MPKASKVIVRLRVNGEDHRIAIDPRRTLLDLLRDDLELTGAKRGCNEGTCGACTVLLDGQAIYACMTLAIDCEGKSIETIEGLEKNGRLHPVQQAFLDHDALQCGFCTPGQIMSAVALLRKYPVPTVEQIEGHLSGNLCRCGSYPKILKAVLQAGEVLRREKRRDGQGH